ncbi:glycoprotein 3-alpha-L-fucosyltransferase A-like [Haliotis rubra]|uniref:glycoprotein 3-alpha-L-fucosyltransferase A-like n=1 Tax=Haliotis rubra TaxID=36100 RepID=UPI001EE54A7C|nr:glycoprotein 3-alpha-L-fucosyltransferase A-like [Haliotis rubra]
MTFRHDSDIFRPYGVLRRRQNIPVKNYTSIVEKKTGLVAWMVSNCEDWSKRRSYVKELQKHIQVDIYGFCGKRVFKRDRNKDWMAHLNETYKFYLAFENNFCLDYISEKFFSYFNLDLVTVVRGGGDYSRDAPPKTYLNVDNFKSPKELADYLWFLNNNTDRYIDILKRKEQVASTLSIVQQNGSKSPKLGHGARRAIRGPLLSPEHKAAPLAFCQG